MHKRACKRQCTFKIYSDDEAVLKAISEMENLLTVWVKKGKAIPVTDREGP
jgi:hypothetical protein